MQVRHIAIIGLGSIGKRHLKLLRALDPALIISLVRRTDSEQCEEQKLADNIFFNLEDAVNAGIQAAIICTPSPFHLKQASVLLNAGVHLLIEKPLSDQIDGLDVFQKSAASSNIIITIAYFLRFRPDLRYFYDVIKNTGIGKISEIEIISSSYLPDWRPGTDFKDSVSANTNLGGGVLLELCHELDYMQWIFSEAKTVLACFESTNSLGLDVEEEADLNIISKNDEKIKVHLDFNTKELKRYCSVTTEKGKFLCDFLTKEVSIESMDHGKTVKKFDFEYDYPYMEQLKSFINCIENCSKPLVSLEEGVKTICLIDAAKKSALSGKIESVLYVK